MPRILSIFLYAVSLACPLFLLGGCYGFGMEPAYPLQLRVLNKSSRPLSFCFAGEGPKCESEIAPGSFDVGTIFMPRPMTRDEVLRLFDEQALLICGSRIDIKAIRAVVPTFELVKGGRYQIEIDDSTQDAFCKTPAT